MKLLIHHCTCFALKFKFAVASVVATVHPSFLLSTSSLRQQTGSTIRLHPVIYSPSAVRRSSPSTYCCLIKPTICDLNLTADSYPPPPFLIITLWTINSSPTCCTLTSTSFIYFATAVWQYYCCNLRVINFYNYCIPLYTLCLSCYQCLVLECVVCHNLF